MTNVFLLTRYYLRDLQLMHIDNTTLDFFFKWIKTITSGVNAR